MDTQILNHHLESSRTNLEFFNGKEMANRAGRNFVLSCHYFMYFFSTQNVKKFIPPALMENNFLNVNNFKMTNREINMPE